MRCQAFYLDAGVVAGGSLSYSKASIRKFEKCIPTRLSFARVVRISRPAPNRQIQVRRECWDRKGSADTFSGRLHWQREWRLSGTADWSEGAGPKGNEASDIVEEWEGLARGEVAETLSSPDGDLS